MNKAIINIIKKTFGIFAFFVPILLTGSVSAISSEEIFAKVLINNVPYCYKNALVSNIGFTSYSGFNSLMNDGYKQANSTQYGLYIPAITDDYNKITEVYSENGGRLTSCYAIFNGDATALGTLDGNMKGLFEIYGKSVPDGHTSALNDFMNGLMQYSIETEEASSVDYCYTVYVKESTTAATPMNLGSTCINEDNYPLNGNSNVAFSGGDDGTGYTLTGGTKKTGGDRSNRVVFDATVTKNGSQCYDGTGTGVKPCSASKDLGLVIPTEGTHNFSTPPYWYNAPSIYVEIEEKSGDAEGSRNISYAKDNNKWRDFIVALTGKSYDDFAFSDAEKYDFYLQYLKNNYGRNGSPIGSATCQANKPGSLVDAVANKYYIYIKGSGWCLANLDANKVNLQRSMTVFAEDNNRTLTNVINTLPELIELMGKLNYDDDSAFVDVEQSGEEEGVTNTPAESETPSGSDDVDACYNGAGVLGWIVCPITSGLSDLGSKAYKLIEENFLQIRASSIFGDSSSGVYDAWGIVRNIANFGFIIMFLIVIFSQITGVGIDNYGIKRILPKLIVGAILMNLSYIICELAIDVSNIAGSGLKNLLTGMGEPLSSSAVSYSAPGGQYATVFGTGVIAVAIGMILSSGELGAVLMLFVALLSVVISILVLFIVLIVRQAGVVVCVVVAPVAMMCYLLPNTEKIFKKWLNLMKGLLLVYPLCGLVIGAGDFVGRIFGNLAANSSDALQMGFALSAMIVQAVPYLFIPTLLKSSLAAMGNLGAKISGLGNRLRGGATKKIQNSDAMKASRQRANDSRAMRKAGFSEKRGGLNAIGKAKAKFARTKFAGAIGYTRMQNARVQSAEKIADMNKEAAASLSSETAAADIADYVAKNPGKGTNDYFQEQIDSAGGDIRKLDAVILTAQKRGVKNKDIAAMIRKSQNSGKLKFANNVSRANWMNSVLRNHGDIMATDYDLQEWARDGGTSALGDYGDYVGANRSISDVDINDLSKMSGDSLAGAIKAGLVSSSVAQQWLAANPNQSADKKVMMGAVASGAVNAGSLSGVSANEFKKEAQSLLDGGRTPTTSNVIRGGVRTNRPGDSVDDLVASWTTTAQTRAYVSQDSSTLKPGQEQREPVWVTLRQGTGSGGSFNVQHGSATTQTASVADSAMDMRALGDETLLDIATNPNARNNDAMRTAAEQEYLRRNPGFNGGGSNGLQNPPENPPRQG